MKPFYKVIIFIGFIFCYWLIGGFHYPSGSEYKNLPEMDIVFVLFGYMCFWMTYGLQPENIHRASYRLVYILSGSAGMGTVVFLRFLATN